jgi:hypothetical protein
MGRLKSIVIISAVALIGLCAIENIRGQDTPSDKKASAKTAAERKKMLWWRQRKANRARDSALKAHMKHQTRAVRKRMRKDAKKAKITNQGGDY